MWRQSDTRGCARVDDADHRVVFKSGEVFGSQGSALRGEKIAQALASTKAKRSSQRVWNGYTGASVVRAFP